MKLNRKARRARKDWRRPSPTDTPQQQFAAFLKQPGKIYAVELPGEKSFVVKVTDAEMGLFTTMCQQLRAVLGHCEARGMTPVEAHVADHAEVAVSSAESTLRIREARQRQAEATEHVYRAEDELAAARQRRETGTMPVDPTGPGCNCPPDPMGFDCEHEQQARHESRGKRRGPRHAKPEPSSTFDLLAAGADNDEGNRQLAALELAAAQDEVRAQTDKLNEANERYADAAARAAELNNDRVLEQWAEKAGQAVEQSFPEPDITQGTGPAIENDGLTPFDPQWKMSVAPGSKIAGGKEPFAYGCPGCGDRITTAEHICPRYRIPDDEPLIPGIDCQLAAPDDRIEAVKYGIRCDACDWTDEGPSKGMLAINYGEHIRTHHAST